MTDAPEVLKPLRTWSHLAGRRRRPTEYEVVSTNLHYRQDNPDSPWELDPDIHMNKWYRQYCNDSPLRHEDWDAFRDPDQLVYRTYNILQDGQETYVRSVLEQFSDREHDSGLSPEWVAVLASHYTPARYLFHTLQMASSYLSQMAPASTISNCTTFQTADSLRWLTHTAYRTVELSRTHPGAGFGEKERQLWEQDPAWQGFRELMEKALVAWDWAEAFTAVNLVAKPAIEGAVIAGLAAAGRAEDDLLLALLADSQMRDAERHRRWASALVGMALETEGNKAVLDEWVAGWQPLADNAVDAYCSGLPGGDKIAEETKTAAAAFRTQAGLD
ncbi:MAG TPA: toluene monooxygenase [Acidimicrobiales bacterium]|nr:toluene monooxygenase [Acidimicrobiales bacterium]